MAQKVKIYGLAEAVMKDLTEYADLATVDMKAAVKKAGNTVKKQIQSTAPKDTGAYGKSWSVKNTKEQKSLSVGSSSGIWSCQARRWPCGRSFPHRSCRRSRYQRT